MCNPEHARGARRDAIELVGHRSPTEERRGDSGEERGLALTLLGVGRPLPGSRGEPARDDGDDEVEDEREPVLALAEVERVRRWQEEPVEGEHARDGDGQCVREAPTDRDGSTAKT